MSSRCECGAWEGYKHNPGCSWDEPEHPEDIARLRALLSAYRDLAKADDALIEMLNRKALHGITELRCAHIARDAARAAVEKLERK